LADAVLFIGLGVPFAAAYLAAFFIPPRPWACIDHIVLIAIGMTSAAVSRRASRCSSSG
jgi:hypothetical protein